MKEIIKEFRKMLRVFYTAYFCEMTNFKPIEDFWLNKLAKQKEEILNETVEYIREKSLLKPEDKAEIIGYLKGMGFNRPK